MPSYASLSGSVARRKRPADFEERASRAYERFKAGLVPTLTAAAEAEEGMEPYQLQAWARSNVRELPDADGFVVRQKRRAV